MQVSRPKSMPDFSALLNASTPLFEARAQNRRQTSPVRGQGYPRKKVSISLAAGLIMNENQKNAGALDSPYKQSLDGTQEEEHDVSEDSLFHAYALKVSTPVFVCLVRKLTLTHRATSRTLLLTSSRSPRPPSARNGGPSFDASTLMRCVPARNSLS